MPTVEVYDPATNRWSRKADMPTPRYALAVAAVNGKIYAIGGQGAHFTPLATVEIYDPVTDTWSTGTDMPTARSSLAAAALNGKIYAIGGVVSPLPSMTVTSVVERYNTASSADIFPQDKLSTTWAEIKVR